MTTDTLFGLGILIIGIIACAVGCAQMASL